MSEGNVELVKQAMDAFNHRDAASLAELVTPDFEFYPAMMGIVGGDSFRGRPGVATYFQILWEAWDELVQHPDEIRDLGDQVLVVCRMAGRGRGSGVAVEGEQSVLYELRGAKISRVRGYLDHAEALRAAGLVE
jgi:ketosteroid isomerase-like protein